MVMGMAYCTVNEVLEMLKPGMMDVIVDDKYTDDFKDRIQAITPLAEKAIEDAGAEIDGYLSKRYDVPFENTPRVINKFCKDIALYNLVSRQGIDESDSEKTYLTRYNSAISFLTKVASGVIEIGVGNNTTQHAAQTGFSMSSSGRIFSRDSMGGW